MIKANIKYLLFLSILLLGLSGQLFAHTHKKDSFYCSLTSLQKSNTITVQNEQYNQALPTFFFFSHEENIFFEEAKAEEEHFSLLEKQLASTASFYSFYYRFILFNSLEVIHFSKLFLHFSPSRIFVIFGVFRI